MKLILDIRQSTHFESHGIPETQIYTSPSFWALVKFIKRHSESRQCIEIDVYWSIPQAISKFESETHEESAKFFLEIS